jgi:ATP-dependent Lhr-like helicase
MPGFVAMDAGDAELIVDYMLSESILFEDGGMLSMGAAGGAEFGWRNFMELLSVFTSPPMFRVLHGRSELGEVHRPSFEVRQGRTPILILAGRAWAVTHIDWDARIAYVKPTDDDGRSRWPGDGQPLGIALCHAMRHVLAGEPIPGFISQRAQ